MNKTTASLALAALLASGCGSSKPDPKRDIDPALPMVSQKPEDKGQGHITFRYSNKTTDANLAIDLGTTDVYLEMSGKAAQEQAEAMREAQAAPPAPRQKPAKPAADDADQEADDAKGDKPQPLAGLQPDMKKAKAQAKTAQEKKPEPLPEEEEPPYEDVTAKVLSGIRRAQELFYHRRYPEAMQAVRSSLDARSTAEGHALAGSIHFMQGQTGMARRQWMEALRLNPDMPAVVNMLEKTRTPGGRGSPSPRPVYRAPAPAAPVDAPYPDEYSMPTPAAPEALAPEAAAAPASAAAPQAGRPAPTTAPAPVAPPAPAPDEPVDEAAAPAEAAIEPAVPAPAVAAPTAPAKPAAATPAAKPAAAPAAKPAVVPATKTPVPKDTTKSKADPRAAKEVKKQ